MVGLERLLNSFFTAITLWGCGGLMIALLIALVTLLRMWHRRQQLERDRQQRYRALHAPDSTPLPPLAEGICGRCGQAMPAVHHLPDGRRLCPACYHEGKAK